MSQVDAFLTQGCIAQDSDGRLIIGWGDMRRRSESAPAHLSIYAPDFFLRDPRPWRIYEHSATVQPEEFARLLEARVEPLLPLHWQSSSYEAFAASFDDIQRRIADRTLVKAVPFAARRSDAPFGPARRAATLARLLRSGRGSSLHAYGLWDERSGMIGATPETLFEEHSRGSSRPFLRTMALAGTRTPGAPSLLEDPKEMHEHLIVVDGIVESLSPLGEVVVGDTDELRLPHLVHLHTPIEAHPFRSTGFDEWVTALHPTAAIGAWPKEAGWRWLQDQPNAAERDRYGAPFGFLGPDASVGTCLVGIRNVQWDEGGAKILAGGGIVAESRVEREWREFNAKLDTIQGVLGL